MNETSRKLLRRQLDQRFKKIPRKLLESPKDGWIKTIRQSLNMSGSQLARHLHTSKQTVRDYEASESSHKISIETLEKVAEALDAKVYILMIPKTSLQDTINNRAKIIAENMISSNARNMEMEEQGTSKSFMKRQIDELTEELIKENSKSLWDII